MDRPVFNIAVKPLEADDDYNDHKNYNGAMASENLLDRAFNANKPNAKVVLKPTGSKNKYCKWQRLVILILSHFHQS